MPLLFSLPRFCFEGMNRWIACRRRSRLRITGPGGLARSEGRWSVLAEGFPRMHRVHGRASLDHRRVVLHARVGSAVVPSEGGADIGREGRGTACRCGDNPNLSSIANNH